MTGFTVWFTGLSGSGKSTLANALAAHLARLGMPYELLDGDVIRQGLCSDLGFSARDRNENVRRIGVVAAMLNRHQIVAIVAAISPYRAAREKVRQNCRPFVEVHVDCPLEALIKRDTKGLYSRALAGEIENFSGVSDPYEPPEKPEVYLNTSGCPEQESLQKLLNRLRELRLIAPADGR